MQPSLYHVRKRPVFVAMAMAALLFGTAAFAPLPSRDARTVHANGNYILLSSYAGSPGSMFVANGYGFQPNETVQTTFSGMSVNATADGAGSFASPSIGVPYLSAGSYPVTVTGLSSGKSKTLSYYVHGYYPTGGAMQYYLMPNQKIGFFGHDFSPGEAVEIRGPSDQLLTTVAADGSGNFDVPNVYTIPFSMAGSSQTFKLAGKKTGMTIPVQITVGQFHPNISPSTYYLPKGSSFSLTGMNFAPNEPVDLYVGGTKASTVTADGGGNVGTSLTAPASGSSFEVRGMGAWSGRSSVRTMTLAQ